MYPYIDLLNREISTYGLLVVVGAAAAVLYMRIVEYRRDFPPADTQLAFVFCAIGACVGAKILYLCTILPQFLSDLHYLFTNPIAFLTVYLGGGFVFYGGFYGALLTGIIYCRCTGLDLWELCRTLIPTVPLFHVFGRIGCFLTGCCYGVESSALGVVFTNSQIAPNGVPLFPVQLAEALGELLLFLLTAWMARKPHSGRRVLCTWMICYGVLRFVLEFLRGDEYRGFLGPLSTSQYFALFSILLGVFLLYLPYRSVRRGAGETGA